MCKTTTIILCLFLVAISLTGWSQNTDRTQVPGIPGYLDLRTGAFRPMPLALPSSEVEPPPSNTGGKIVLNLTVTLTTSFPSNEVYSCGLSASTLDLGSSLSFLDEIQITATKTGMTLTCTVTLPYSWALVSQSSDMMMIAYSVNAAAPSSGLPIRIAQHGLANIKVPANGTTTTFTTTTAI